MSFPRDYLRNFVRSFSRPKPSVQKGEFGRRGSRTKSSQPTASSFILESLEPRLLLSAGLTAGYALNETSGTTAADASGNAIVGTLTNGPTWGAGKNGNGVILDGVNDYVNLGTPASLQVTGSLTLSAWVNASAFPVDDATVVSKRASGELGFQLDVTKDTGPRTVGFKLTNSAGANMFRYGATTLQANTWYHIAGVYDAATQSLHVYLNGQLDDGVAQGTVTTSQQNSSTTNVTIGRRAGTTGYEFAGRLDDVRIYDRALTTAEIQTDMQTPLGAAGPDTIAPTVLSINRATASPTNAATVQWTVTFSEAVTGVDLTDFALAASGVTGAALSTVTGGGSTYTVTASTGTGSGTLGLNLVDNDSIADGSANPLGGTGTGNGNVTGQVYTIDKAAPTVTINQATGQTDPAGASPINFTVVFSKAVTGFTTGDVTLSGTAGATTATVTGSGTTYNVAVTGMTTSGTVSATVAAGVASDAAGNLNQAATSTDNTVTFASTQTTGLTAGYAFNETSGTTAADASGNAIVGTLTNGPTWGAGKNGNGVILDGVNDYVNLGTPASLQVTGSLTLSAWVNASAFPVDDATVVSKRASGELGFQLDVTKDTGPRTVGFKLTNSAGANMFRYGATTLQANTWYHIAGVYDAATQSLHVYLNGQLDDGVAQGTVTTSQQNSSTTNVTIGRRAGTTGYEFAGRLDDVRIYDRALTTAEIQTDMQTPLGAAGPDTIAPTVLSINRATASPTNAATVQWTVTFSEAVTGVDLTDFALAASGVTGAALSTVTGGGSTYTVTASTGTGSGTLGLNLVDNDSIADGSANPLGGTGTGNGNVTGQVYTIDKAAPTVTINQATGQTDPAGASPINFTVVFSKAVTGFTTGDVTLSGTAGATTATVTGSGTTYNVAVTGMTTSGTVSATVAAGVASDAAGNLNQAATSTDNTVTFATGAPTVLSINRATASPTNAATVQWTVTFSEAVTGVDLTDFALAASGVTGAALSTVTGGGSTYTVMASTGTGSGTLGLNLVDNDSIADGSANPLGGTGTGNGNVTGQVYTIDKAAPTVTINQATGQTDPAGASPINFTVVFSKAVTGFTTGDVTLSGTAGATTATVTGSGTTYNVAVTGMTTSGTVSATVAAGVASDAAGNLNQAATSTDNTVTFATGAPTVLSINRATASPTNAATVQWTVTFSEAVTGVDLTDFALAASGVTGAALSTVTGGGSTYTVTASTGTGSGTLGLNLVDNDSIADGSANPLGGTGTGNGNVTGQVYTIDKAAPTVTINQATGQTDPAGASPINFTVVFSKAVTGFTTGDVTLSGTAGATTATVTGSGTTYNVAVTGMTTSGTVSATVAAGVASDAAGNLNQAATSTDNTVSFASTQTTGLTAGYAFNETSGTTAADASGNAIVGTLTNGPTWGAGKNGNGVILDGVNDYVNLGTPASLQVTGSLTLSAWVNASAFPVDDATVVSKRASGELGFQLDVTKDTGPRTVGFKLTNSAGANMFRYGATTLQANTWYHIAGVYDAATQSLHVYLNGQLDDGVAQGTVTTSQQNSSTTNVTIGRRAGTTGYEFAGRLDDVRIYDRALTTAEIQTDMQTPLGAAGPDTIAPTVLSINRATASPTNAATVQWTVTFSEAVTGVDLTDFALAASGVTGAALSTVTGGGSTYTVTASTGTGSGTLRLNLVDNDSIADGSANPLGGTGTGNGNVTGQVYTIDKTDLSPPVVQVTQPTQGSVLNGIVVVSADATDDVGVAGVQFFVDGVATGAFDAASPYALSWDTRTVSNGAHTLTARADDASGNSTLSASVTVNVSNTNNFRNEILATGFDLPAVLKFLPDGRALVAEVAGVIKVVPPPYTTPDPTPFLDLNLNIPGYAGIQQGIQGVALDPDFVTNHYYYVFYTNDSPNKDRLSRFTANSTLDGTIPGSEVVLYEDPQVADTEHHGGAVNFGNDGKIYFTTGDHFQGTPAQDLTSPRGKVLRINPDGTVPTDNPFHDGNGPNYDAIWAYGLRNPFRASYDTPTGRLFIGDVGGNDWSTAKEEVNLGVRGANYGWPNVEGNSSNPAYTNPIYSYAHNGRDAAVVSGFVYRGNQFPSSYQGNYFFADYTQNWIKRLTFDANGNVTGVFNFEPADGAVDGPYGDIVYLTEGPDGALYYLDLGYSDVGGTFGVSKLRRIQYIQGNLPPVVQASATPTEGANPLTVTFTSVGSSDPEGQPLTYQWAFGDGQTSTLANPQHTYATPGLYNARLTISDGVNSTISPPIQISVGDKPVITTFTTTPANNGLFRAGDVISFSATASDSEDGALPGSAFTWMIDFLHGGHVHPGALLTDVTSGTFTIPTSGHDFSGDTRYRITLTVTDSTGLQTTRTSIVYPDKVNLTFDTAPGGLTIYLDGIAHTAPFVYDTLIGFNHTIEARNQTVGTSSYAFASWSDGGAQQHTIMVPTSAQSYTANYTLVTNPLPSGLVAGWNFNETAGTSAQDISGNGNTATLVNGVGRTTGNYGGGLTFDGGNDYLTVPNSASLNVSGTGLTLSMWINPQASGSDSVVLGKFWNPAMTSPYYQYGLELTGGTVPNFFVGTSGGPLSASMSSALALNQWSYLAVVFSGSQVQYYVNGVLVTTVSLPATITGRNNGFQIGADNNIQQFFKGSLDEMRIYNRALTAQEVLTDMNSAG